MGLFALVDFVVHNDVGENKEPGAKRKRRMGVAGDLTDLFSLVFGIEVSVAALYEYRVSFFCNIDGGLAPAPGCGR